MSYRRSDDLLYLAIPTTGAISEVLDTSYMDHFTFVVSKEDTGNSTVATWQVEGSSDGTVWAALQNTQQTCNNSNPETSVSLQWNSFVHLRVKFVTISSGGDTYRVHFSARGI